MLGKLGASDSGTNLIIHHGITDILDQAAKPFHIFGAVQEPCDLASPFQWGELLKNTIQFPNKRCTVRLGADIGERVVTVRGPSSSLPP